MKEIFKGIIGMTVIIGLFLVFNTVTQFNAPDLGLMGSTVKGLSLRDAYYGSSHYS